MEGYIPLLVAALTVFAGLVGYIFQRRNETIKAVNDAKREAYVGFIRSVCSTEEDPNTVDYDPKFWRAKILFYGSDDVIKAFKGAHKAGTDSKRRDSFNKMMYEMRKDCMGKTNLELEDIAAISPF